MAKVVIAKEKDVYNSAKKVLELLNFSLEGKKVFIKPNLTTGHPPESGITTDKEIVRAVLERLKRCEITIGDGSGGSDTFKAMHDNGYVDLAKNFGAKLVDLNQDNVVNAQVPDYTYFKSLPVAKSVLDCDYFINVSKLKIHALAGVTMSVKNLFGTVIPLQNKLIYHHRIRKVLVDLYKVIHSDLNLVDGFIANQRDEVLSYPVKVGVVFGGYSSFWVDWVGSQIMCVDPSGVEYLKKLKEEIPEEEIEIAGRSIEEVKKPFKRTRPLTTKIRYICQDLRGRLLRMRKMGNKQ